MKLKEFRLSKKNILELYVSDPYFSPNQVTETIAEQVKIAPGNNVIEIGGGIAGLTILLLQKQPALNQIYSSEISRNQYSLAKKNIEKYGFKDKVKVFHGNLFDPINEYIKKYNPGFKADVIVDDVSGMNEIGIELDWYPDDEEVPVGGEDGTEKVIPILEQAPNYLKEGEYIYFPVLYNYSDGEKILKTARNTFKDVEMLIERTIPLRTEQVEKIENSNSKLFEPIEITKSRKGRWRFEVYRASNPR